MNPVSGIYLIQSTVNILAKQFLDFRHSPEQPRENNIVFEGH